MHSRALRRLPGLLALALLLPPAAAQTLRHVRVSDPDARALARSLEHEGLDVVEGSVGPRSLELVLDEAAQRELAARGLALELLGVGRPYREIQREALAAQPGDAVPGGYSDLAGITARMNAAAAAHPALAQVVDLNARYGLPLTHESRSLLAIKISDNVTQDEDEPNALLVAAHHAREIVTPEIALRAMERLLNGYGSDPTITALVDGQEIWILPVANPDGYRYVFEVDNYWRKNRRSNGGGEWGVDTNRNYPFLWDSACSGSTFTSSETYKGPWAGSEPETQVVMALSNERRFARVLDYHSYGREVLWAYASCSFHPFGTSFLRPEAIALSVASGYGGDERQPSADGEHYQWQLGNFLNLAFLIETHTSFQPSFSSAQAEADLLWPGILHALQRPLAVSGHVTDAVSGQPVEATIRVTPLSWQYGEGTSSGPAHGRYSAFLRPGSYTLEVSAPCYQPQSVPLTVATGVETTLDIALQPGSTPSLYCTARPASMPLCVPALSFSGAASASAGSGFTVSAWPLPGKPQGLWVYTTQGAAATPVQNAYGTLCISTSGLYRFSPGIAVGTPGICDGRLSFDFNQYVATQTKDPSLVAGATVDLQAWYRDPPNPGGANLTGAASFLLCP